MYSDIVQARPRIQSIAMHKSTSVKNFKWTKINKCKNLSLKADICKFACLDNWGCN